MTITCEELMDILKEELDIIKSVRHQTEDTVNNFERIGLEDDDLYWAVTVLGDAVERIERFIMLKESEGRA